MKEIDQATFDKISLAFAWGRLNSLLQDKGVLKRIIDRPLDILGWKRENDRDYQQLCLRYHLAQKINRHLKNYPGLREDLSYKAEGEFMLETFSDYHNHLGRIAGAYMHNARFKNRTNIRMDETEFTGLRELIEFANSGRNVL